ncbi:MAG: PepSY domain-containing protein, partial [Chitinophagaceae bacterium]
SWQGLFQKMALQYPDYHFIQIAQSGDIALLPKEASHNKATDKYKFHKKDSSIMLVSKYKEQRNISYLMSQSYTIHAGSWNIFTKILWCLAALIGASLPITGYIFYWKRKK